MLHVEPSTSNDFSPQEMGLQTIVLINSTRPVHCADGTSHVTFAYKSYDECSLSMKVIVFKIPAWCLILRLNYCCIAVRTENLTMPYGLGPKQYNLLYKQELLSTSQS